MTRPRCAAFLAMSLDGFIATHEGESRWVTGHENLVHMAALTHPAPYQLTTGNGAVGTPRPTK